jgi:hypothetical protein
LQGWVRHWLYLIIMNHIKGLLEMFLLQNKKK